MTTTTPAGAAVAAADSADPPPLRANRDFRLLWIGQALSDFGSAITFLVLPLVLLRAGYSAAAAGTIGTATLLTGMGVRVPAGYLTDRFDARRLMLGCDLVRLAVVGAVAVWTFAGRLPVAAAVPAVVVAQVAMEVFRPSQSATVRRVVPTARLATAMSANQARAYAADIAAPAAAGLLLALSPGVPFTVDAATFAASALCVAMLSRARGTAAAGGTEGRTTAAGQTQSGSGATAEAQTSGAGAGDAAPDGFWRRLTAGLRYLVRNPFMRTSAVYFALTNLLFQALVYALILGVGGRHGGGAVGAAMSSAAVAGLAGSFLAPYLQRRLPLPVILAIGPGLGCVLLAVAWRTGSSTAFAAAFATLCLLTPVVGAALGTVMATTVPEEIYGRTIAASGFTAELLQPLGPLAAGLLLASLSLPTVAALFALVLAVLAALAMVLPDPAATAVPAGPPAHS